MYSFESEPTVLSTRQAQKSKKQKSQKKKNAKKRNFLEILGEENLETLKNEYFYIDRPKTPLYKSKKPQKDKSTQILRNDKILFDFENMVESILEVMVAKVLEISKIEIFEENFLAKKNFEEKKFRRKRNAEILKTQRMVDRNERYLQEKERRVLENQIYYENLKKVHRKMYSRNFVKKMLFFGLEEEVLENLEGKKCFGFCKNELVKVLVNCEYKRKSEDIVLKFLEIKDCVFFF